MKCSNRYSVSASFGRSSVRKESEAKDGTSRDVSRVHRQRSPIAVSRANRTFHVHATGAIHEPRATTNSQIRNRRMTAISLHSAIDEWTFHKPSRCEVRTQQCVSTKRRPFDFHFANGAILMAPRVALRWQSSPRSRGTRTRRITSSPNAARHHDSSRRGIRARRRSACSSVSCAGPRLMLLQRPTTSAITPSAHRIAANAA